MARIAVAGFQHESNSFVEGSTGYDYFASHRDRPPLVFGNDVLEWLGGTSFAIAGFLSAMQAHSIVPLLWTSGGAGAEVTDDAFERIAGELLDRLADALPVDAVYLDLHGAMVTETFEDGEGELLRRIRKLVGEKVPVVVSLDYHANVTPDMLEGADALIGYLTYPHTDRFQTGERAARAMEVVLTRGRPSGRHLRKPEFLLPLTEQCTLVDPSRRIVDGSRLVDGEVLCLSYLAGFPLADIHWCGPSVVAYAWTQEEADRAAGAMTDAIAEAEQEFSQEMASPEAAVALGIRLAENADKPVIIADVQDNPGAGGSADTTGILSALVAAGARNAVAGFLCDADAALMAHEAGVGASIVLALGGKSGPDGVLPFSGTYRVLALGSGRFRTSGAMSGVRDVDLGPMALLEIGGVEVVVTSKRMQAYDQEPFRHLGVEPRTKSILVLKSTCHFRADFEPMAEAVIIALAPGHCPADPTDYPFRRLRRNVRLKPLGRTFGEQRSH